jgi:hypothetical protein
MTTPFETRQQTYYTREINRGLPTQGGPAPGDVAAAVTTTQAGLGASAASFLADFGESTQAVRKADGVCRGLPYPSPAMRDPGARTGCGWWFVPDTTRQSIGALGTRRGPMNPMLDTIQGAGKWIWDPVEAEMAESLKRAGQVRSCPDLVNSGTDQYAWCPTTNMAVPIDPATGALRFPTSAAGDCPGGTLVRTSDGITACSQPTHSAATYGYDDSNTTNCSGDGPLSPKCLYNAFTGASSVSGTPGLCSTAGTLAQALSSGQYATADDSFNRTYAAMSRQFTLNAGTYATGKTTTAAVIADSQALANFANSGASGRARAAAESLCYGTPFDPCSYSPADAGPFDLSCIRTVAVQQFGYASSAGLLTLGDSYWNNSSTFKTWQDILNNLNYWKAVADNPPGPNNMANPLTSTSSADIQSAYTLQQNALRNVYGIILPQVTLTCVAPQ